MDLPKHHPRTEERQRPIASIPLADVIIERVLVDLHEHAFTALIEAIQVRDLLETVERLSLLLLGTGIRNVL